MPTTKLPPLGPDLETLIGAAAEAIRGSRRTIALTGAGLSVESGIPPFRGGRGGAIGLWDRYDPNEFATLAAFRRDPGRVWLMLAELGRMLWHARPNEGHRALARMEKSGFLAGIITQNVDGLHQSAGSTSVLEFHGNWRTMTCMSCRSRCDSEAVSLDSLPPRCACGGALKPDVILLDEIIPASVIDRARTLTSTSECLLVIGTSAEVAPAASIPYAAHAEGLFIIEVNTEPTVLSSSVVDLRLEGPAGLILSRLAEMVCPDGVH